jgi:DNA replication and repair protein RecF
MPASLRPGGSRVQRAGEVAVSRLAVDRLEIAGLRSWPRLALETGGAPVALWGPNGSGKTNLLEAVSMLVPGRGLRRAGAEALIRLPERRGWRVRADVATPGGTLEVMTGVDDPESPRRRVEIDGKPAPQTALGRHVRMVWLTPAMDRLWTGPAADRRALLDRIALGFEPEHGDAAQAYEKAMRQRNRLLADGRADPAWLDALEAEMARRGARIARARADAVARLAEAAEARAGAGSPFPRPELSLAGPLEQAFARGLRDGADGDAAEAAEAAGLARALAEGRRRDAEAGRALEGPHRSDLEARYAAKDMPARLCSTGEQKALLIALCLANARALADATGAAPILLLDEVAAHLDDARRRALFAEIAALDAQAWMTATEPWLFDGLEGARAFRVAEEDGASHLLDAG